MTQTIQFCAKAGFKALDVNFCAAIYQERETIDKTILVDDWRGELEKIALEAERCQVVFPTAHLPFYNFAADVCENRDFKWSMTARSIEASAILGAKWAVIHPGNSLDDPGFSKSKRATIEYIKPCLELAEKFGLGIAVENMARVGKSQTLARYCADVDTLCDLVDTLGQGTGICWDFGHANVMGIDQVAALQTIGNRLKMTHVHDNNGLGDEHLAPFMGSIQWEPLIQTLREISYSGDLNFEVSTKGIPDELREKHAQYLMGTGNYLLSIFNK